jgi:hypothetical protein
MYSIVYSVYVGVVFAIGFSPPTYHVTPSYVYII